MKRVVVIVVMLIMMFGAVPMTETPQNTEGPMGEDLPQRNRSLASSAAGEGDDRSSVAYMTRTIEGQTLDILNDYLNPDQHTEEMDLSDYHIPGWSLYEAQIDVDSLVALAERETMGIVPSDYIRIHNDTYDADPTGLTTDALYQEFYSKSHDGKLENYTFTYLAPYYTTSLGIAYVVVRSNYSDLSANTTGWITPFSQSLTEQTILHDCSSDNAIMNSSTPYYVVVDGTAMFGVFAGGWRFNRIFWASRSAPGLETGYHVRDYSSWYIYEGIARMEAELNYTYIPWNKTSDSALTYADPSDISLRANLSALSGLSWAFVDDANVSYLEFDSDQSVRVSYSLTLSYKKATYSTAVWTGSASGQSIDWNVSTSVEYPSVSEDRYLNVSVPTSWSVTGLYNTSSPGTSYEHYSSLAGTIVCSELGNDTYTLMLTSHNHLTGLDLYQAGSATAILESSRMDQDIDINSTVSEADMSLVSSGTTNLTVWFDGSVVWNPTNETVQGGSTHYFWDISATVTSNGQYTVEEFWANGTEAGYRTTHLLLYYPTEFGAESYVMDGFTESSLHIQVSFNDTFTPQGLGDSLCSLEYSFDGGTNTSLVHSGSGIWVATIPTTGKSPGTYVIEVYAEGFALENRSLTIDVDLIHDTNLLSVSWSNTDSITYVQSTEVSVSYERVGGIPITDAWVNLTIGTNTWNLTYDGISETYKLVFNGTDSPPGLGIHAITLSGWKVGHKAQVDTSESLTISQESTSLSLTWTGGNSISFVGATTLVANYTMSNGTAVMGATVTVSVNTTDLSLDWDGATRTYRRTFNGDDVFPGIGISSIDVHAELFGYITRDSPTDTLTISEEGTSLSVSWTSGSSITYIESTILVVEYKMSNLTPIDGATVNVTIEGVPLNLNWHSPSETYRYQFDGTDDPPGLGSHPLTIQADRYGFVARTDTGETLTINEEPTIFLVEWSSGDTITFVEQTTLSVTYQMSDTTPISTAEVNVTFDSTTWNLTYNPVSEKYEVTFLGWDSSPGIGVHDLTILADLFGFQEQTDTDQTLTITEEPTSLTLVWSNTSNITYVQSTTLTANYSMSNGSAVLGAEIIATIGGNPFALVWNAGNSLYEFTFEGSDDPPGLGTHSLTITAEETGYQSQVDSSETLTLRIEPTLLQVGWVGSSVITYVESTTLVVDYTTSDGTPIEGATVTATIDGNPWTLVWNPGPQDYRHTFLGSDSPPGLGVHLVTVECALFGYTSNSSSDATLTINQEPTSLDIQWSNGYDLAYFDSTYLLVDYRMSNLTTIQGATVNVTIDGRNWRLEWNSSAGLYTMRFNGSDSFPGVGTHSLTIRAGLFGFVAQTDSTQELILPEIPTSLTLTWVESGTITYIESTILRAIYEMYNGTPIDGAEVNATIDGTPYAMTWNAGEQAYEVAFSGDQDPPGFGTHTVTVVADKTDFVDASNADTLTILTDPTTFLITWSDTDRNITYHGTAVLSVQYLSSASEPIEGATLNATIGTDVWPLVWNVTSSAYETVFYGDDSRLGFATFTVTIRASLFGYQSLTDSSQDLTIRVEDSSLVYVWDPSSTITYVESTIMNIRYLMSNGTSIRNAVVNVTIGIDRWDAVWNESTQSYQVTFFGSDDPPSLGTHTLFVRASKPNYQPLLDYSQYLSITNEPTSLDVWWSDGNAITYVEQTTVWINYSMSDTTKIEGALIEIKVGGNDWFYPGGGVFYDSDSGLYYKTFYGSDDPPGLGNHGLIIEASRFGFAFASNNSLTLTVTGELGQISTEWVGGDTITFVESTIISVNYTMSNGTAIEFAEVNVTIDGITLDLFWDPVTETYRRTFYGNQDPPGLGTTNLLIQAWRDGFDYQSDSTKFLTVTEEPTTLAISWFPTDGDNISYFESTTLRARFLMSNGSDILGADVNVTINSVPWSLTWNGTSGYYEVIFNGSDSPPGLGTHTLLVRADKYGYVAQSDAEESLTLREDSTSIAASWLYGNNITFIERSYLVIHYRMSNGTNIQTALVNVSVGLDNWIAAWNSTEGAYTLLFTGADDPPGFGSFAVNVEASATYFETRNTVTELVLRKDPTSLTPSWISTSFDWTDTVVLSFDYRDSSGALIPDVSQKQLLIDGSPYALLGTNGTYYISLDNSFDLGSHVVQVNISKFGYSYVYLDTVSFTVVLADTTLDAEWSSITIDYLGQIDLTILYQCVPSSAAVPMGEVTANLTIDGGAPIPLIQSGSAWILNLTGVFLDLGIHTVTIRAGAYGYVQQETVDQLTVLEVVTDPLVVVWNPSNLTIEYFDNVSLSLEYAYYGGDVPEPAEVNVTINGRTFNLAYSAGTWGAEIRGEDIGLGYHTANILASAYGYEYQSSTTLGINVTQAANSFIVIWEPPDLQPSYVDTINVSVIYTQDFQPILGATVRLTINSSDVYELTYSPVDERWHLSIDTPTLGLGNWNMTMAANKTGYADGLKTDLLTVVPDTLVVTPSWISETTDYLTPILLQVQLNASNGEFVVDASVVVEVDGTMTTATHLGGGLYEAELGPLLDPSNHTVNVTATGVWFYPSTTFLDLDVVESDAALSVEWSNTTIYYTQIATGDVYYEMLNGSPIVGTATAALNGTPVTVVWVSNHWEIEIEGISIGLGSFLCTVNVSGYGFSSKTADFVITIQANPTDLSMHSSPLQVLVNQSLTILVDFENTVDGSFIVGAATLVDWPDTSAVMDYGNGTYGIQLSTTALDVGSYSLNLSFSLYGFETAMESISIDILIRPMTALYEDALTQYENETIIVEIQVLDAISAVPLDSATVAIQLNSLNYTLEYDSESETYMVEIWLNSTFSPGEYEIQASIEMTEYDSQQFTIQLAVLEKRTYDISLEVSEDLVAGGELTASLTVTDDGTPIADISVTITLTVTLRAGGTQTLVVSVTTDSEGHAHGVFQIPQSSATASVIAEYAGSLSTWPSTSDTVHRDISTTGGDILTFLVDNPLILVAVGGTGGVAIVLFRRRRGTSKIPDRTPSSSPIPSPEYISDSQRVEELIAGNPDGLTRKEISENTGFSSSKVGEIVRNLLDSDSGFYEWREGRQRIIRYKAEK